MIRKLLFICACVVIALAVSANFIVNRFSQNLPQANSEAKFESVVLFMGSKMDIERENEANQILFDGISKFIIIPVYGRVQNVPFRSYLESINNVRIAKRIFFFENTHMEVLEAKNLMLEHNIGSAIFVSSSYHLRRIKIITRQVFERESKQITFKAPRCERIPGSMKEMSLINVKNYSLEYIKTIWFIIYSQFL